jgi:hypothetical protein
MEQVSRRPAIVIGTPHSAYQGLIFSPDQVVIDIWS